MKKILIGLAMVLTGVTVVLPAETYAVDLEGTSVSGVESASTGGSCDKNFLGFQAWYNGLTETVNGKCEIRQPDGGEGIAPFVVTIILNILSDLFVAVGYLTSAFILYGGFLYVTASGDPGKTAKAKKTISSAVIGLAIVIFANVIINLIVGALTEIA